MHKVIPSLQTSTVGWLGLFLVFSVGFPSPANAQDTPAPTATPQKGVVPPADPTRAQPTSPSEGTPPETPSPSTPSPEGVTEPPSIPAPPPAERPKGLRLEIGPVVALTREEAESGAGARRAISAQTRNEQSLSEEEVARQENERRDLQKITGRYYRITITNRTAYPCVIDNLEISSLTTSGEETSFRFAPLPIRLKNGASRDFYLELDAPPPFPLKTVSANVLGYFDIQENDPNQRVGLRQAFPLALQNPEHMKINCTKIFKETPLFFWVALRNPSHIARQTFVCTNGYLLPVRITLQTSNSQFFFLPSDTTQIPAKHNTTFVKEVPTMEDFSFDIAYDPSTKAGKIEGHLTMEIEATVEQATIQRSTIQQALEGQTFARPVRYEVRLPRGDDRQKVSDSGLPIVDFGKLAQNELDKYTATISVWTYEPFEFRKEKPLQFSLSGTDADNFTVTEERQVGDEPKRAFKIHLKPGLQLGANPVAKLQFSGTLADPATPTHKEKISFAFQLQGMVEKPIRNQGKILLGQVSQGKAFRLPVELPISLSSQVPFTAQVIDSKEQRIPGIRILPANEKEVPSGWDGKTLRFVTTQEAGQNLEATFELRVGNPANPDIYRWVINGTIIPTIEQQPLDLGEVFPGSAGREELQWPSDLFKDGGLMTSWTAALQNTAPKDVRWLSIPKYGASLRAGSLDPLYLDFETPPRGYRGQTLTGLVLVEITNANQQKVLVSRPVSLIVSRKTPWILDVSMSHLGLNLYHAKNYCNRCGTNMRPTENDFNSWEYLWMLRGNASYAFPVTYYHPAKSTHVEARPGLTAMMAFSPNTQMMGLGFQLGLGIYPGQQRFLQLHMMPFLEYRYVGIPQIAFGTDGTFALADRTGQHRFAGGTQFNVLVDLGKKIPSAHGWSLGLGWHISGMYASNGSHSNNDTYPTLAPGAKADVGSLETGGTMFAQKRIGF